ncbi:MAG: type I asparaginase [Flavobacteriales bacterium]|nr:type I asparaginase [Flavobacteriales bacterium]
MSAGREILLIYTGGTIGMVQDNSGILRPFDFELIHKSLPELQSFDFKISTQTFEQPIDSSNMHPAVWLRLAKLIENHYNDYDGFVILHGTDTMSYTASALSFLLEGLNKPVVLTGSQLPIGVIRTDGKENLITALEIAADYRDDIPVVPEVAIYFEYQLYRGNRTTKYNAEYFDAFDSPNYSVLAKAGIDIRYRNYAIRNWQDTDLKVHQQLDESVGQIKIYPGIKGIHFQQVLNVPGLKALVIESFGSGNIPNNPDVSKVLKAAVDDGIIILNITQCSSGTVHMKRYATNAEILDIGIVDGLDLTFEAAITKLMFVLGLNLSLEEAKKMLIQDLAGELTPN